MSIIEKLGITSGPWEGINEGSFTTIVSEGQPEIGQILKKSDGLLIAAAPEMLIWIIGMMKSADNNGMIKAAQLLELGPELLEKAAGKTWKEIKELL